MRQLDAPKLTSTKNFAENIRQRRMTQTYCLAHSEIFYENRALSAIENNIFGKTFQLSGNP